VLPLLSSHRQADYSYGGGLQEGRKMIEGRFGEEDELFFEVELIANNGLELPADALLDTGFSGWLAMDSLAIEELKN